MELDQDDLSRDSTTRRRAWLWVMTCLSTAALVLGVVISLFLEPYNRARMAAIQLQALGAGIDYNDASLSVQFREGWRYFSNRNLAITASAIYCRKDRHRSITDQDLVHIRAFPDLYWLDLRDQSVSSNGLSHLTGLRLEALTLTRTKVGSVPHGLAPLGTLPKLLVLKLNETPVNDNDLTALSGLRRLNSLDLSRTQVSSVGVKHLSGLTGLSSLNLSWTKVDDSLPAHLDKMKNLMVLDLRSTAVTGAGLDLLRGSRVGDLALADTRLTDEGLRAASKLPLLTELNLARTHVSPAALGTLAKLKYLRSLNISGPGFNDEHLAVLSSCPRLQALTVYGANVSAKGFQYLKQMKTLTRIELDGNLLWKPELVTALKELPRLTTIEFKLSGKMMFDFEEVQEQLGPKIRIYQISELDSPK